MKRPLTIFPLLLLVMMFCVNKAFPQLDSLVHNSLVRTYLVHLPSGYTGASPVPMVVAMHGGFGSAINLQSQSQLSVKADAEGFIVVYPEGVPGTLNIRTWNAGGCCGYAAANNIDDVGFIDVLIDTLMAQFNIDTTRIYATGMSNGGFMAFRLACELSHRLAAIAPVAATMNFPPCNPTKPVPLIQFHSYLDTSVPYNGGVGNGISNHYNPPHDSVMGVWSGYNDCLMVSDTLVNNAQYTFVKWDDCDCGYEIHYYITTDGGHSWPGGVQTPTGDPPSAYLNANNLMWDFFQQYTTLCNVTGFPNESTPAFQNVILFPNPSSGIFYLSNPVLGSIGIVDVYGRTVKTYNDRLLQIDRVDISPLPDGIYFLLINNRYEGKIVKKGWISKIICD